MTAQLVFEGLVIYCLVGALLSGCSYDQAQHKEAINGRINVLGANVLLFEMKQGH